MSRVRAARQTGAGVMGVGKATGQGAECTELAGGNNYLKVKRYLIMCVRHIRGMTVQCYLYLIAMQVLDSKGPRKQNQRLLPVHLMLVP